MRGRIGSHAGAGLLAAALLVVPTASGADLRAVALDPAATPTAGGQAPEAPAGARQYVRGGAVAGPGEVTFGAYIEASSASLGRAWSCSASLVAPRWILTAAHCVAPGGDSGRRIPEDLVVRAVAGGGVLSGAGPGVVRAQGVVVPDEYLAGDGLGDDVALVRVPARGSATLPVARPEDAESFAPGVIAGFAGYGLVDGADPADAIHYGFAPVLADEACAAGLDALGIGGPFVPGEMICTGFAGGATGSGPCAGDSGGPLFVGLGDAVLQAGVVSWGWSDCSRGPSVFAELAPYTAALVGHMATADPEVAAPAVGAVAVAGGGDAPLSVSADVTPGALGTNVVAWWGRAAGRIDGATARYAGTGAGARRVTLTIPGAPAGEPLVVGVAALNGAGEAAATVGPLVPGAGAAAPGDSAAAPAAVPLSGAARAAASQAAPTVRCAGRRATIVGTAGPDVIVGTAAADVIVAGGGDDDVRAHGGGDVVCLGPGDDRARGGAGDDRVLGEGGADRLLGGPGRDDLTGGRGADHAAGGAGRDRCRAEVRSLCEPSRRVTAPNARRPRVAGPSSSAAERT